jgi:hypothetical protein
MEQHTAFGIRLIDRPPRGLALPTNIAPTPSARAWVCGYAGSTIAEVAVVQRGIPCASTACGKHGGWVVMVTTSWLAPRSPKGRSPTSACVAQVVQ